MCILIIFLINKSFLTSNANHPTSIAFVFENIVQQDVKVCSMTRYKYLS